MSRTTNKFAPEVRERAVCRVLAHKSDHPSPGGGHIHCGEDRLFGTHAAGVGEGRGEQRQAAGVVERIFAKNFGVYGVRKVWRQIRREGFDVAPSTVERLLARLGLQGSVRGKLVRTT